VVEKGRTCKDCHSIPAAKTLLEKGSLRLVWVENGQVKHLIGVIPIVNGTTLIMQTFVWNETLQKFQPFEPVKVEVRHGVMIENTLPLTLKDLQKMAKTPEELMKERGG